MTTGSLSWMRMGKKSSWTPSRMVWGADIWVYVAVNMQRQVPAFRPSSFHRSSSWRLLSAVVVQRQVRGRGGLQQGPSGSSAAFCGADHLVGARGGLQGPPRIEFTRVLRSRSSWFLGLTCCEHAGTSSSRKPEIPRCSFWTRLLTCPLWCDDWGYGPDSVENCLEVWCSFWTRLLACPLWCNARCRLGSAVFCVS